MHGHEVMTVIVAVQDGFSIIKKSKLTHCVQWLIEELKNEGLEEFVEVKTINQCRGLEYSVLVTITANGGSTVQDDLFYWIETWTRVRSSLFIIHMENEGDVFSKGLRLALRQGKVLKAKETEKICYSHWQKCKMILTTSPQIRFCGFSFGFLTILFLFFFSQGLFSLLGLTIYFLVMIITVLNYYVFL